MHFFEVFFPENLLRRSFLVAFSVLIIIVSYAFLRHRCQSSMLVLIIFQYILLLVVFSVSQFVLPLFYQTIKHEILSSTLGLAVLPLILYPFDNTAIR